ncbi:hypothetical protein N7467_006621 [Penicillium canescens]|nr:hypothetical protein N7467_006621 [Penicillium canescens]
MANKMSPSGKADLQFLLNCIYFSPELKLVHEPVANALRDMSKADGTACMFLFEQYGPDPEIPMVAGRRQSSLPDVAEEAEGDNKY